jgi:hypothetical protein
VISSKPAILVRISLTWLSIPEDSHGVSKLSNTSRADPKSPSLLCNIVNISPSLSFTPSTWRMLATSRDGVVAASQGTKYLASAYIALTFL